MKKKKPLRIREALYWKFRTALEAWEHEQNKLRISQKNKQLAELEIESLRNKIESCQLKASSSQKAVEEANEAVRLAFQEYNDMKGQIEQETGKKLEYCSIDPVTRIIKEER